MIGDFLTKIKRVGTGLGVHMLDRDLAAFIQTRRANQIVKAFKARNYMAEEDVKNISHTERERTWLMSSWRGSFFKLSSIDKRCSGESILCSQC